MALAAGMRFEDENPDMGAAPRQPVLVATGTEDSIFEDSKHLAEQLPSGGFVEIPGRHHFNAPGSLAFRRAGTDFLREGAAL